MNYIELFAGCGGLSLGLKSVGFKLVLANELSPMAAESYAFNFFNEDLQAIAERAEVQPTKTLWLTSKYGPKQLKTRLRENPKHFPQLHEGHSDIDENGKNLQGSLVVGSIVDLNLWLDRHPSIKAQLSTGFGSGEVDLVSGGPPCQSFSMAGLRRKDCEKNSLPWEFAKFAQAVKPKLVLLENVTGILRPFKDELGNSYYAWFELAKAFAEIGYIPLCLHVNAKYAGVPQNRPRFILLGVREHFYDQINATFNEAERTLFAQPVEFFLKSKVGEELPLSSLMYRDISKQNDLKLFEESFLAPLVKYKSKFISVKEAIDDLRFEPNPKSLFSKNLTKAFKDVLLPRSMANHVLRTNNKLVQRRFRIYQVLKQLDNATQKRIQNILKGQDTELSDSDWEQLKEFKFLKESGNYDYFDCKSNFLNFLMAHQTKKQTQKALLADQPAPAALSIPDDACHYDENELRTLTVREMARIQSFPDEFQFRSKTTTGGDSRQFEVPQYTQVGNAVPPLLGRALGLATADLLKRIGTTN